jgi:hypothetical protein
MLTAFLVLLVVAILLVLLQRLELRSVFPRRRDRQNLP